MFDHEEYNRWMNEAENTFKSAIVDKENEFYKWSCFKCHQAAEFVLKGLLYGLGLTPFGHLLTKMTNNLKNQRIDITSILISCKKLDLHYIPSRYPNAHPSGSPFEYHDKNIAEEVIANTKKIMDFVKGIKK